MPDLLLVVVSMVTVMYMYINIYVYNHVPVENAFLLQYFLLMFRAKFKP